MSSWKRDARTVTRQVFARLRVAFARGSGENAAATGFGASPLPIGTEDGNSGMKLYSVMAAACLALSLASCGPTQSELDRQAQAKAAEQDKAAQAELDHCNAQYPSPVVRENAVAKFQCMNTAYHHFTTKLDDADEDYFAKNLGLSQQYADGAISYDEMKAGIAKNFTALRIRKQTLSYQAAMTQAQAEEAAARARTDRAVRGAQRQANQPDMPDAE